MKPFVSLICGLALVASNVPVLAQTAGERAYQIAVDQNACNDLPILEAEFTNEAETEIRVVCGGAVLDATAVGAAIGAVVLLGLAVGGGGSDGGSGDSTSDTR